MKFETKYVASWKAIANLLLKLKTLKCPHCGAHGYLVQHGFLWGVGAGSSNTHKRGKRFLCCNRYNNEGCGGSFSVLLSDELRGMSVQCHILEAFLVSIALGKSIKASWELTGTRLSLTSAYRLFKRLKQWLPALRSHLHTKCSAPSCTTDEPWIQSWQHLKKAFGADTPMADFQLTEQKHFFSH